MKQRLVCFAHVFSQCLHQCLGNISGNISTSRITAFLEFILKPISTEFCKNCPNEFCQDSRQYNGDLLMWKERLTKNQKLQSKNQCFTL